MDNKVSNPKVKVPSGMSLNEKDYISELLSCLKAMEKDYTVALTEASNEDLYNKYYNMFLEISKLQREVYEVMFRHGWYCLEKAETTKISQKANMLTQELQSLSSN